MIFYFENFWIRLKQKYPKGTSTQKVSGIGTASFLEYPCFIDYWLEGLVLG